MLQQCGVEMVVKDEEEVMVEMGDFFDNFDSLLDFPMEDIEVEDTTTAPADQQETEQQQEHDAKRMRLAGGGGFFNPPPADDDSFNPDTVWPTTESDLNPAGLHLPYEDFPPLEWMSSFMEDPFASATAVLGNDNAQGVDEKTSISRGNDNTVMPNTYQRFQSSSPVSVLETSSSNSVVEKAILLNAENVPRGRARSKRPRPATFTPRPVVQFMSPATSSITDTTATSELLSEVEDYVESHLTQKMYELNDPTEKKKKISKKKKQPPKRKLPPLPGAKEQPPRKCLHCEITKTPQWRAGPMGPKTLCNACGVRYKSGRLFPEYRPAASPTFVPAKHSNSHRKVLEMRVRCGDGMGSATTMATSEPSNSQLVDLDVTGI